MYRDRIRVFYSSVASAEKDGYKDYNSTCFSKKNGYLYSFTGLRGDAKKLYKACTSGTEKRVKIVKAKTPADQAKILEGADMVIWAAGYLTNKVTIKDFE